MRSVKLHTFIVDQCVASAVSIARFCYHGCSWWFSRLLVMVFMVVRDGFLDGSFWLLRSFVTSVTEQRDGRHETTWWSSRNNVMVEETWWSSRDSCHGTTWQLSPTNVTFVTNERDICHERTWHLSRTNVTFVTNKRDICHGWLRL